MFMNSISFIILVVLIASMFVLEKQRIVQCIWLPRHCRSCYILALLGDLIFFTLCRRSRGSFNAYGCLDFAARDTCPSGRLNLFCYSQVLTYLDKCKLIQKSSMFFVVLIASLFASEKQRIVQCIYGCLDFAAHDTCPRGRLNLFCYGQVLTLKHQLIKMGGYYSRFDDLEDIAHREPRCRTRVPHKRTNGM